MLAAAPTLSDIPTTPPITLSRDDRNTYSVALGDTHKLVFRVGLSPAVDCDLATIRNIEILGPTPVPATRG